MAEEKKIKKSQEASEQTDEIDKQKESIDQLKQEIEHEKEKKLMALAELENYKKRVQKERESLNVIANAATMNILLEIIDDLNRAVTDMENPPEGLMMIQEKAKRLLEEHGVKEIEVKPGDKFEPGKMEAIGTITVKEDEEANKIIHVERKGYMLDGQDFMIRAARVIVGKKT